MDTAAAVGGLLLRSCGAFKAEALLQTASRDALRRRLATWRGATKRARLVMAATARSGHRQGMVLLRRTWAAWRLDVAGAASARRGRARGCSSLLDASLRRADGERLRSSVAFTRVGVSVFFPQVGRLLLSGFSKEGEKAIYPTLLASSISSLHPPAGQIGAKMGALTPVNVPHHAAVSARVRREAVRAREPRAR